MQDQVGSCTAISRSKKDSIANGLLEVVLYVSVGLIASKATEATAEATAVEFPIKPLSCDIRCRLRFGLKK